MEKQRYTDNNSLFSFFHLYYYRTMPKYQLSLSKLNKSLPYYFYTRLISLSVIIGFILRIVLIFNAQTTDKPNFFEVIKIFTLGSIYDISFCCILLVFFQFTYLGCNDNKYKKPYSFIIELFYIAIVCYVYCFHSIFHQYGGGAPIIAKIFFTYKLCSYTFRLFFPKIRFFWRKLTIHLLLFFYILFFIFNAVSEYFFWNEFGVRYNFIAVDYLIYTNEVIGNIFESYPIIPLLTIIILISIAIQWFFIRNNTQLSYNVTLKKILSTSLIAVLIYSASWTILSYSKTFLLSKNLYANELQANGGFNFIDAFKQNKLEYNRFYPLLPNNQCHNIVDSLSYLEQDENFKKISTSEPQNIVLITVESLSAKYLKYFGNTSNITPYIDQLISKSLVFDSLYATGNRTVRGLEATSLCSPPTTGESIIKRPNNKGYLSIGNFLNQKGYNSYFLYGGDSYFDNMGNFFSNNGYKIIDKSNFKKNEITFSNIWGVCDEDIFNKALQVINNSFKEKHPLFLHIMTVSNHRPFTFPSGRIKYNGNIKSREAAVKYTDYAIGNFLKLASKKEWFKNTFFIIVADHCASSAGNTSIPIDNYHIPAIIYAPYSVSPKHIKKICSQIDLMPTTLALLGLDNRTHFSGKNVLSTNYIPRAFMATYQDMGYYKNNILTVLSPVKQTKQYKILTVPYDKTHQFETKILNTQLANEAKAYYQLKNIDKHGKQN